MHDILNNYNSSKHNNNENVSKKTQIITKFNII
jgi:hypothetical protein